MSDVGKTTSDIIFAFTSHSISATYADLPNSHKSKQFRRLAYLYCFISSSARSSPKSFAFCKFCKQSCFFFISPYAIPKSR